MAEEIRSANDHRYLYERADLLYLVVKRTQRGRDLDHGRCAISVDLKHWFADLQGGYSISFLHVLLRDRGGTVANEIATVDFKSMASLGDIAGPRAAKPDIVWTADERW